MKKGVRDSTRRIARGARSVTAAVIISRLLGLVREQVLAAFFGATSQMDAFVVAYRIPNLLRDLFAEGALGMAFTRVFSRYREREGPEKAFRVASEALTTFGLALLLLVILGEILAPEIVGLLAPEFKNQEGKFELTVLLARIMIPFLFFISLAAMVAGMLNSLGVFFWPAFSSALFNATSISAGLGFYFFFRSLGYPGIIGMALGVLLGGAIQAGFNWPFLRAKGFRLVPVLAPRSPAIKEILKLMGPSILGLSAVQINIFLNTYFATSCGEGAVSWLAYAFRLMYVPLGLFGVGLSLALLPEATRQAARGDLELLKDTYVSSLLVGLSLSLPSAVGLAVLAEPIVRLIFERGAFSSEDTLNTARALSLFALGLPAYAITKVTVSVFYALGYTLVPALGSFLAVGLNLTVVLLTLPSLHFKAIALGTAVSLLGQAVFLTGFLWFKLQGLRFKKLILGSLKLFVEAGMMGVLAFLLKEKLPVLLNILVCGMFFLAGVRFLGPEEGLLFWKTKRTERSNPG